LLSAIIIISMILFLYFVGYRYYAKLIDKKVVHPDDNNPVPAVEQRDNVDFYPAPEMVLFGHHFSSIAGAGPIIGPIVAVLNYGWVAALGWIALGSVFIGAVHDYLSLMVSARNRGDSVADVAEDAMNHRAKLVMSAFIWMTLVLIVSVFGILAAKTMVASPQMVIPTFGLILVAVLFGKMVYRFKFPLVWGTVLAVLANIVFILVGSKLPIVLPDKLLGLSALNFWFIVVIIYCAIASLLPVQVLLQPRDYIATFNLYSCLLLGVAAIIIIRPQLNPPAFISFDSPKGPLYPMLFILVACGAVSGFHSLVAGGTTSKQLAKESYGKPVAYGGMLVEGVLATMTLLIVAGGLYWVAPNLGNIDMSVLGLREVNESGGWIMVFGHGFGNLVSQLLPFIPFTIASMLAMIALNTFILTTCDTATRISRFVVQETLGELSPVFKNKVVALVVCIIPIFIIGYTNTWGAVWPVFGAANQLIAALTLFVISAYLLSKNQPTKYTVYPGIFMLVTTVAALIWQGYHFFLGAKPDIITRIKMISVGKMGFLSLFSVMGKQNFLLGSISVALIVLAVFVTIEAWKVFKEKMQKKGA